MSVRKHCHHRNTACHYGNTVCIITGILCVYICHYGNTVCMSSREHHVYVITGTPPVCHHGNTMCMSSREHHVYVITGTPCVCHHGNTVCMSSREHRVYVITRYGNTVCKSSRENCICFSQRIATEKGVCTCIKDVLSKPDWHHSPSSDYRPALRQGSRQSLPCGVDRTQDDCRCWPNPVSHRKPRTTVGTVPNKPSVRHGNQGRLGVGQTQCPTWKPRTIRCWPNPVSHTETKDD